MFSSNLNQVVCVALLIAELINVVVFFLKD